MSIVIAGIDLVEEAETGATLKLVDPHNEEVIYVDVYEKDGTQKLDKDGKPVKEPITIKVLGARALSVKKYAEEWVEAVQKKDKMRIKKAYVNLLTHATVGWTNMYDNGTAVECNEENKKEVFGGDKTSWVAEQVFQFITELGNFKKDA